MSETTRGMGHADVTVGGTHYKRDVAGNWMFWRDGSGWNYWSQNDTEGVFLDALASAQAELRDVKRVDRALADVQQYVRRDAVTGLLELCQEFAETGVAESVAEADSLAALGRMLTEGER